MNKLTKKIKRLLPRILLISGGIILIFIVLIGGIKANDYIKVNKLVKAADFQIKSEMYTEAYDTLNLTQSHWTTAKARENINTKIGLNKQLTVDKENYLKGLENQGGLLGHEQNYQAAKDYYLKVSILYPHYKEVQENIAECQKKLDEANAQVGVDKQTTTKTSVADDPFPVHPGYGACDGIGSDEPFNTEKMQCEWSINNKYRTAMIEWYARHGQNIPDSLTPGGKSQNKSTCEWSPYVGLYGGLECSSN